MDALPQDKILKFNENTLHEVRKIFDLHRQGDMEKAIEILDTWVQKQQHFNTSDFDKKYLENTIIVCKGSIERAKERLDKSCTLRTLMPHLFGVFDIRTYYQEGLRIVTQAVLPRQTKNNERVYFMKNTGQTFDKNCTLTHFTQAISMLADYVRRNDYAASYYAVIDYTDVNLTELLPKLTLHELQEAAALILDCGGFRVASIYLISTSKLISILVKVYKQFLSDKIGDRIHVVKDFEAIHEKFGDIIPQEYGGKEKSLQELHDEWVDVLTSEEHCNYLRKMQNATTNEASRPKAEFNQQYIGLPGTFRTLSVD